MFVLEEPKLNLIEKFAINVIKKGQIPNHVAFIMDGNRRFAKKINIDRNEGHMRGYSKMFETLHWCIDVGIKEVTVYAFSIENFKRSQEEVLLILSLLLLLVTEERGRFEKHGVCFKVFGNLQLLPKDIQKNISEAMLLTKDNRNVTFNVAFAYTSRDEITNSINTVIRGVKNSDIRKEDVCEELLEACLYTKKMTEPDLLIRTSGEVRLSDFLLWQSSSTILYFIKTLWPEFTFWNLLGGIFYYQRSYDSIIKFKSHLKCKKTNIEDNERVKYFLENMENT